MTVFCKMLSPLLSQGAARYAELRRLFVRPHGEWEGPRMGRQTLFKGFAVAHIPSGAQLKMIKGHTITLLVQFNGMSNPSFRRVRRYGT
jgi:hypothetical protein